MNSHVVYELSLLHISLLVYMLGGGGGGGYASRSNHVYPLKVENFHHNYQDTFFFILSYICY